MATGITPAEWEENKDAEEAETEGAMELTVTIPFTKVNVANLTSLLEAKGSLIKDALGITDLRFEMNEDSVSFPWFKGRAGRGYDLHKIYYSNLRNDHEAETNYCQAKGKRK